MNSAKARERAKFAGVVAMVLTAYCLILPAFSRCDDTPFNRRANCRRAIRTVRRILLEPYAGAMEMPFHE